MRKGECRGVRINEGKGEGVRKLRKGEEERGQAKVT